VAYTYKSPSWGIYIVSLPAMLACFINMSALGSAFAANDFNNPKPVNDQT